MERLMPTEREWLQSRAIRPRKRLGQNFLLDTKVTAEIVRRASWPEGAVVCEIGAGGGALTSALLESGRSVLAVEMDPDLAALLAVRFAREIEEGRLLVRQGDALDLSEEGMRADMETLRAGMESLRGAEKTAAGDPRSVFWLAGNLPYGITTPILLRSFHLRALAAGAVFMVQREYGERMLARAGDDAYGSLSVWTAAHARARLLLRVGRSSFWPRPGVESVVVELVFPDPPPYQGDAGRLERVLRAAFGQRRKTLENALAHGLSLPKGEARRVLVEAGCDPAVRAERLSLEEFAAITKRLEEAGVPESGRVPESGADGAPARERGEHE
jgi:16S rRNA (adenine1518-N6/adenine1519-N6)-dimethyltransferase